MEYSIDIYKERLGLETSFTFGAFEGEELIGIVTLVKETSKKLKHRASIFAMYVSHNKRGLGAGKKLMAAAIVNAKELKDVEQIHLTVMAENEPAKNLYASFGFETYGTEKHALKIADRYYDEEMRMLFV